MNNEQRPIGDLLKDFTLVGTNRVHPWFAWAIVGVVMGMFLGIVYVANQGARFSASQAAVQAKMAATRQTRTSPQMATTKLLPAVQAYAATQPITNAKVVTGIVVPGQNESGIMFNGTPVSFALNPATAVADLTARLGEYMDGTLPFRVTLNQNSPIEKEMFAFGTGMPLPTSFALTVGQEICRCDGSVSYAVTCSAGGTDYNITKGASSIYKLLDQGVSATNLMKIISGSGALTSDSFPKTEGGKSGEACVASTKCDAQKCVDKLKPGPTDTELAEIAAALESAGVGAGVSCAATAIKAIVTRCNSVNLGSAR